MEHTITVSDKFAPVLDWLLEQQQKADPKGAPKDHQQLIQNAIEGMILEPWKQQFEQATVINIQDTLNNADQGVRASAVAALTALQSMTPEQQKAALDTLAAQVKEQLAAAAGSATTTTTKRAKA